MPEWPFLNSSSSSIPSLCSSNEKSSYSEDYRCLTIIRSPFYPFDLFIFLLYEFPRFRISRMSGFRLMKLLYQPVLALKSIHLPNYLALSMVSTLPTAMPSKFCCLIQQSNCSYIPPLFTPFFIFPGTKILVIGEQFLLFFGMLLSNPNY